MDDLLTSLLLNLALVATLVLIWDTVSDWTSSVSSIYKSISIGFVLAAATALSMSMAMETVGGNRFDLRGSLIVLAALFGGWPAALITGATAVAVRLEAGGAGVEPGLLSIALTVAVGLLVRRYYRGHEPTLRSLTISTIGVVNANLAGYILVPAEIRKSLFIETAPTLGLALSCSTLLIGVLLMRANNRTKLTRENQVFRQIVQQLPHAIDVRGLDGEYLVKNPARDLLLSKNMKVPANPETKYGCDLGFRTWRDTVQDLAKGATITFDHEHSYNTDKSTWLSTLRAPLRDSRKRLIGVITCSHDITDEKAATEAKNRFISTVSHELRTPLTSIKGSLGLITSGELCEFPSNVARLLTIAQSNCDRLVDLINEILDIEKIATGSLDLKFETEPLRALLEQAVFSNSNYQSEKGVSLILVDDLHEAIVNVDAGRVLQVLGNLLSNAIKFSPDGGTVTISTRRVNGDIEISVQDEGPGVPKQFHARIFGRFEQSDSSDARAKGGTGLGLHISKQIINRLGGKIGFDKSVTMGARFHIHLPEVRVEAHCGTTVAPEGQIRALVCSAMPDVTAMIVKDLGAQGLQCDLTTDPRSITSLSSQRTYAGALIDAQTLDGTVEQLAGISLPITIVQSPNAPITDLRALPYPVIDLNDDDIGIPDLAESLTSRSSFDTETRLSILHVEDDIDTLDLVDDAVGPTASIMRSRSLAEARRALHGRIFDLIILDIDMPDGSGLDLLNGLPHQTKVIVFAGKEAPLPLSRPVKAVLVKSRSTQEDVAELVRSIHAKGTTSNLFAL